MRNIKTIFAAAATVPVMALGGGLAYASTSGSPAPAPAPAVTATITATHPHTQPATQPRNDCQPTRGQMNCGDRNHSQQQARTTVRTTGTVTGTQRAGHPANQGTGQHGQQRNCGHGNSYQHSGYQGNGSGYYRSGNCGWGC